MRFFAIYCQNLHFFLQFYNAIYVYHDYLMKFSFSRYFYWIGFFSLYLDVIRICCYLLEKLVFFAQFFDKIWFFTTFWLNSLFSSDFLVKFLLFRNLLSKLAFFFLQFFNIINVHSTINWWNSAFHDTFMKFTLFHYILT